MLTVFLLIGSPLLSCLVFWSQCGWKGRDLADFGGLQWKMFYAHPM
jgi:hypothetical protein